MMDTSMRAGTTTALAEVDSETIQRTYTGVLWAPCDVPEEDQERIGGLLLGHVQLLVPEVTARKRMMRGTQQCTAQLVLDHTNQMLKRGVGTSAGDIWDLAVQCRALHTLYLQSRPLDERSAGGADGGRG
ncbi:hypothetical protein ACWDBD_37360 [Streptomyces sp. NPDC001118]